MPPVHSPHPFVRPRTFLRHSFAAHFEFATVTYNAGWSRDLN